MKTFSTILLCVLACLIAATDASANKKLFPDTTDGFHWFLVFDTPIWEQFQQGTRTSIDARPYDLVWGAADMIAHHYRASNPDIVLSFYIPWSRDNDGTHDLAYWNAFKPEWVLYKCDRVTPAKQFEDPHMPLDISNPDVIDWQLTRYIDIVRTYGYDGIAADNFAVGNALEACGVWKDGQWVQKYTGNWDDAAYTRDALHWLETFYAHLTEEAPDLSFGINYSLNLMNPADPRVITVMDHLDYIMDEAGYTTWGFHKPTPQVWDEISTWIETIQAHGKHYFGINEFVDNNRADKEWGMSSYLMSKNGKSSMVCTLIQGYGIELAMPEYDALNIGQPMGPRFQKDNIWFRQYSNGLAVINVWNDTKTFTLANDGYEYKDVSGNTYGPGVPITIAGQTGIVMGATKRPATVTLTTAASSSTSGSSGIPAVSTSGSTSSNPNPATTSTPNPATSATSSNPNPATSSTPTPPGTSSDSGSSASTNNPNSPTTDTTTTTGSSTSSTPSTPTPTDDNPTPTPAATTSDPNPPSSDSSTTGSSSATSGSPSTTGPVDETPTEAPAPGSPSLPPSTTPTDEPVSAASSQSLSSFAVVLALFIFAFLW